MTLTHRCIRTTALPWRYLICGVSLRKIAGPQTRCMFLIILLWHEEILTGLFFFGNVAPPRSPPAARHRLLCTAKWILNYMHFKHSNKKCHNLIRLKRTTIAKNKTVCLRFNVTKSFGKHDRVGLPRPGFLLAPPPPTDFLDILRWGIRPTLMGVVQTKTLPDTTLALLGSGRDVLKSDQFSRFGFLLVKIVEIPEPWGQCSASSTWCLFSTFSSGYVVLRSSATPVRGRISCFVSFFEANRLATSFSKETTTWSVPESF